MAMYLLPVCAIVLLLVLSGFFAGSETALTAVSRGRMFQLEREGSRAAANVNALTSNRERLIGALLLGNTFVNILASALATSLFEKTVGKNAVPIVAVVMTLVILIFSEVLPKTLAIARTDQFALSVAGLVRILVSLLAPIVTTVQSIVWWVLRMVGLKDREVDPIVAPHEEIRGTVDLHHACSKTDKHDFSLEKVRVTGVVSANSCKPRITMYPQPGTLIFYVRDLTFFERMRR